MIRQKRKIQMEFRNGNDNGSDMLVKDLRDFLKKINQHELRGDLVIRTYRNPYRFGIQGFEVEWEEWTSEPQEEVEA